MGVAPVGVVTLMCPSWMVQGTWLNGPVLTMLMLVQETMDWTQAICWEWVWGLQGFRQYLREVTNRVNRLPWH